MREIKFRAWDKSRKVMENCISVNPFYIDDCDRRRWQWNEVELMQYTGCKDKNGEDIYEGDIVRIEVEDYEAVIEWDVETCRFAIDIRSENILCDFDNYRGKDLEVMGNIYDNPERLEGQR